MNRVIVVDDKRKRGLVAEIGMTMEVMGLEEIRRQALCDGIIVLEKPDRDEPSQYQLRIMDPTHEGRRPVLPSDNRSQRSTLKHKKGEEYSFKNTKHRNKYSGY